MSFIYCHLSFHANLLRPWRFPLIVICVLGISIWTFLYFDIGNVPIVWYSLCFILLFKEALATILTKQIICFGNW
jgi:hypothetical protein